MVKLRYLLTLFLTATILTTCALAQNNLTQIRDTIYNANGTPFNGTLVITWNGYSTTVSGSISPLSTSARIYNGALSVLLVPTTTAAANSYYQVVYSSSDGTTMWTETWQVPPSTNALSVAGVRTSSASGSGSGSPSGSGSGIGSGSSQYATLPIAISQITGLATTLSAINSAASALTTSVNTVTANETADSSAITTLNSKVTTLTNSVAGITSTGSGSANVAFVDAELPTGALNGTNAVFTLSATPAPVASLEIYRNGLVQASGIDYTVSGNAVTFLTGGVPLVGDTMQAFYRVTGTTSPAPNYTDAEIPGGLINGLNTVFALANAPSPALSLKLLHNGILLQQQMDYTLNGSSITFLSGATPQAGDAIFASYRH